MKSIVPAGLPLTISMGIASIQHNRPAHSDQLVALADLPSLEVLRSKLLGLLQAPATKLVMLLNTP